MNTKRAVPKKTAIVKSDTEVDELKYMMSRLKGELTTTKISLAVALRDKEQLNAQVAKLTKKLKKLKKR